MHKKKDIKHDSNTLTSAFIDYVLTEGKRPNTVYHFSKIIAIEESVFYEHFNSLEALEKALWGSFLFETLEKIKEDKVYQEYGVREKLLATFYTFMEIIKSNRSYILFCIGNRSITQKPFYYSKLKKDFKEYANELINEGIENGEVKDRMFVKERYDMILWGNFQYSIEFWAKDDSADYEKTDVAIEKAVNASMDLLGDTFVDTLFDFVKFSFQNR